MAEMRSSGVRCVWEPYEDVEATCVSSGIAQLEAREVRCIRNAEEDVVAASGPSEITQLFAASHMSFVVDGWAREI